VLFAYLLVALETSMVVILKFSRSGVTLESPTASVTGPEIAYPDDGMHLRAGMTEDGEPMVQHALYVACQRDPSGLRMFAAGKWRSAVFGYGTDAIVYCWPASLPEARDGDGGIGQVMTRTIPSSRMFNTPAYPALMRSAHGRFQFARPAGANSKPEWHDDTSANAPAEAFDAWIKRLDEDDEPGTYQMVQIQSATSRRAAEWVIAAISDGRNDFATHAQAYQDRSGRSPVSGREVLNNPYEYGKAPPKQHITASVITIRWQPAFDGEPFERHRARPAQLVAWYGDHEAEVSVPASNVEPSGDAWGPEWLHALDACLTKLQVQNAPHDLPWAGRDWKWYRAHHDGVAYLVPEPPGSALVNNGVSTTMVGGPSILKCSALLFNQPDPAWVVGELTEPSESELARPYTKNDVGRSWDRKPRQIVPWDQAPFDPARALQIALWEAGFQGEYLVAQQKWTRGNARTGEAQHLSFIAIRKQTLRPGYEATNMVRRDSFDVRTHLELERERYVRRNPEPTTAPVYAIQARWDAPDYLTAQSTTQAKQPVSVQRVMDWKKSLDRNLAGVAADMADGLKLPESAGWVVAQDIFSDSRSGQLFVPAEGIGIRVTGRGTRASSEPVTIRHLNFETVTDKAWFVEFDVRVDIGRTPAPHETRTRQARIPVDPSRPALDQVREIVTQHLKGTYWLAPVYGDHVWVAIQGRGGKRLPLGTFNGWSSQPRG
jgi:hypothetical protein